MSPGAFGVRASRRTRTMGPKGRSRTDVVTVRDLHKHYGDVRAVDVVDVPNLGLRRRGTGYPRNTARR